MPGVVFLLISQFSVIEIIVFNKRFLCAIEYQLAEIKFIIIFYLRSFLQSFGS